MSGLHTALTGIKIYSAQHQRTLCNSSYVINILRRFGFSTLVV